MTTLQCAKLGKEKKKKKKPTKFQNPQDPHVNLKQFETLNAVF